MLNRNLSLAIFMFLGAVANAFGQGGTGNQGLSFFIQEPGPQSQASSATVYLAAANPLNSIATPVGPAGLGYVIMKPSGAGAYLIGPGAINSVDGTFATGPRIIAGLPGAPTAATITPDGKTLVVGAVDSSNNGFIFLVDTVSDQIVGTGIGLSGPPTFQNNTTTAFCPQCFIAVSQDSKFAYVLTNTGIGSRLVAINLLTRQIVNQLVIPFGGATSVALSPLGLLYVTAVNAVHEINPSNLTINATTQVFFTPYRLHFTPDGTTAYAVNLVPASGGSLLKLAVASHQAITWPPFQAGVTPPTFDDVVVLGNNRIVAFDSALMRLADVTPNPFNATDSAITLGPGNNQLNVIAVAASNELPNAKFLFFVVNNGNQTNLYRYDLTTNTVSVTNPNVTNYTQAQVVTVPPQTGTASFLTFNAAQTLNTGGTAAPLLGRALDSSGLGVFNAAVNITTDAGNGVVITNASTVTAADGSFQATATIPNTPGTYNITVTVNGTSTIYVLTVPGATSGGPQSTQVTISTGDGQIVFQNQSSAFPLTILVTDTQGNPLQNIPVTFAITSNGGGFLNNPQTQTDANGLASTYYTGLQLVINSTILPVVVNASTQYGSVDFHETVILLSVVDGTGRPQFNLTQPTPESNRTITIPQGTPLPDAIEVQILATGFPQTGQPIPNVGIYTYNAQDNTKPPPASCIGSSLSDANGVAKCTLLATCTVQSVPLGVSFGHPFLSTAAIQLNVIAGGAQKFNFLGGNNGTGIAGQTLNLNAVLTDGCGSAVASGTPVTWAVKSGSATLVNPTSFTDASGRSTTSVLLGQTPGPIVVTVTSGKITGSFNLTNTVVVSSLAVFSGTPQTAKTGQQFASPVIVIVKDNKGNPVQGITVNFSVTGPATVAPGAVATDSAGKAQTLVTAGTSPGTVNVIATALGFSANATLTVVAQGPNVTNTSFTNAASGQVGLVPCGLGVLTGNGVATNVNGVVSGISLFGGPLPFSLAGFSMTVQSPAGVAIQAPIEAVSNQNGVQQVNFQTPCEAGPGSTTVVVTYNGTSTNVTNVTVFAAQPGSFTFLGTNNKNYAAVFDPSTGLYIGQTNFAQRGKTYYAVITGAGQATPAISTDSIGIANQNVNLPAIVQISGLAVPVVSAQYMQGLIGAYLIGFTIPQSFTAIGPDLSFNVGIVVNGQTVNSNQNALLAGIN